MDTDYTYYSDLVEELQIPKDGILSRILLKNEHSVPRETDRRIGELIDAHRKVVL